jgi:hypothetical protein
LPEVNDSTFADFGGSGGAGGDVDLAGPQRRSGKDSTRGFYKAAGNETTPSWSSGVAGIASRCSSLRSTSRIKRCAAVRTVSAGGVPTTTHRHKVTTDPAFGESCRESARKWRRQQLGYWKQYRAAHPDVAGQNRQKQASRDRKRQFLHVANNTSASDLTPCPAKVWLLGSELGDLANNNGGGNSP